MKGGINLSITRSSVSTSKCCFPICDEHSNLHRISHQMRNTILKKFRFYIPSKCVVCGQHGDESVWSEMGTELENLPFTVEQIEDMVDLLRIEPKPQLYSGEFCNYREHSIRFFTKIRFNRSFQFYRKNQIKSSNVKLV